MTHQRQSFGPGRVLGMVSLIVALPLLGGVIGGLVADGILGTSPIFVLSGLAIGTVVTVLWLRSFITTNATRLRGEQNHESPDGEQRQESAGRS